jgi:hypothetical protein
MLTKRLLDVIEREHDLMVRLAASRSMRTRRTSFEFAGEAAEAAA